MSKAAEFLASFATNFGVPYLSGGACTIGDFLGEEGLDAIRHSLSLDAPLGDALDDQLAQAALYANVTPAPFDEDAATFLYAVHELIASCHPQASAFYSRAHRFCEGAEQAVRKLRRTFEPGVLITRHLMLRRLFGTTRTDTHLKWWTGKASFYGTEPPSRLQAWGSIRRVHTDKRVVPLWKLICLEGDEHTRVARVKCLQTLLDYSPLTRFSLLGHASQKSLSFTLLSPLKMGKRPMSAMLSLEDRDIARAVVDDLVERGVEYTGPPIAIAILQAMRKGAPPIVIRRGTELCVHLALMLCIAEVDGAHDQSKALRQLLDSDVNSLPDNMRVFWAAVRAGVALDDKYLVVPSPHELPARHGEMWARTCERLKHPLFTPVAEPLMRELSRKLEYLQPSVGQAR